jgi:hypothetical protein
MRSLWKSRPAGQPAAKAVVVPRVDVYPGPDARWQIGCDEVLVVWDVETGQEAERIIRELLTPELLANLEFDSYPEAFFATAADEPTARAVAAAIQARSPNGGTAGQSPA